MYKYVLFWDLNFTKIKKKLNYDFFFMKTATRIFQALRSLNPPIAAIQLPIENAQKGMYWFNEQNVRIPTNV